MHEYLKTLNESAAFISQKIGQIPDVAIVLGSGLGLLGDEIKNKQEIPYENIPGFSASTVLGHAGKLLFGDLGGKKVLAMQGRFHLYEGYDVHKVVLPVRVFKKLGIKNLIITNAAGGVNRNFNPGDLMILTDHIGLFAPSPLKGPNMEEIGTRFPDMSEIYNKKLIEIAEDSAREVGVNVRKGIYAYASGPQYETPAEIRLLDRLGVDAVGMSTVPEVVAARHAGLNILGISCITNMACGILPKVLSHEEVFETANLAGKSFCSLVSCIVKNL